MKQSDWNSKQYLKFERERTQPPRDLANRIPLENPKNILDLGCGPGNSTKVLKDRFPHARILGVDNSPDMIARAKKDYPELEFQLFDATEDFSPLGMEWDIIFSNACLQWVPDHHTLLPRMLAALRPGGVLAVQIPIQSKAPVHRLIRDLAEQPQWRGFFHETRPFHLLKDTEYCDILAEHAASFSMWETDYYHILDSHQAVLEWYRGTGLRPYLAALPEEKRGEFERELLDGVRKAFSQLQNGSVLFPFARFFFTAEK